MRKIIIGFFILYFNFTGQAQTELPITIDGNLNDWTIPFSNYDPETKLNYAITNDNSNLYLAIKASDEKTQMRLLKTGFQISVDLKGKKSTKSYLSYNPSHDMPSEVKSGIPFSIEQEKIQFKSKPLLVTLNGFKSYPQGEYDARVLKYIRFSLDWDGTNSLIIEYKIPFSALQYIPDTTKEISVGIFLLAAEMPSGMMPPGGMEPPSGMSPPSGVSRPQGMGSRPPPRENDEELSKETKFWTKYQVRLN